MSTLLLIVVIVAVGSIKFIADLRRQAAADAERARRSADFDRREAHFELRDRERRQSLEATQKRVRALIERAGEDPQTAQECARLGQSLIRPFPELQEQMGPILDKIQIDAISLHALAGLSAGEAEGIGERVVEGAAGAPGDDDPDASADLGGPGDASRDRKVSQRMPPPRGKSEV